MKAASIVQVFYGMNAQVRSPKWHVLPAILNYVIDNQRGGMLAVHFPFICGVCVV